MYGDFPAKNTVNTPYMTDVWGFPCQKYRKHTVYDRMYGDFPAKNTVNTPYMTVCMVISQRGLTGEMSKYVPFLHSESSHLLPTQPTDTILALNES